MPSVSIDDAKEDRAKEEEEAWTMVSQKRAARGRSHVARSDAQKETLNDWKCIEDAFECEEQFERAVSETTRKLELQRKELRGSRFWQVCLKSIESVLRERKRGRCTKMVVLGVGSLRKSRASRYQLLFASLVSEEAIAGLREICLYDPAFSVVDLEVLKRIEIFSRRRLSDEDDADVDVVKGSVGSGKDDDDSKRTRVEIKVFTKEQSQKFVENCCSDGDDDNDDNSSSVFVYMPHCEADLYEEVLKHRWEEKKDGKDPLRELVLCGNAFSMYAERWSFANNARLTSKTKQKPSRVVACAKSENGFIEKEISLEGTTKDTKFAFDNGAFNDTAIHVFRGGFPRPDFSE